MAVRAREAAEAVPERSLGLAGSIVNGRYRVNALVSVRRDVVVYRAEDVRNGRPIALEVLRDDLVADAEFAAAVREQARKLATAAHAHRGVARVYDCGTTDAGGVFVALERTEGPTLREMLDARGALDPATALRIASQVGEALEALHHHGTVHGQLDPDSVLMVRDDDGREHVTLVGVELTAAYRTALGRRLRDASPPPYRAPEQIERDETTETADVYALGMLLRAMLTADKAGATTGSRPATRIVPRTLDRIITTAVDPRPQHRYADISVMINDMWGAQTAFAVPEPRPRLVKATANAHRRPRPRRRHVALGIATVIAVATLGASLVWATLSDRVVPRLRARMAPSATISSPKPAMPAASPPSKAPVVESGASAATEGVAAEPAARPISDLVREPDPAPTIVRKRPAPPAVVNRRPRRAQESRPAERPVTEHSPRNDVGDGSAIIDWLLKDRR